MYYKAEYHSPIGVYTMASDGESVVGLWKTGQKFFGKGAPESLAEKSDLDVFKLAADWLDRYFAGEKPLISDLPLNPAGSVFRHVVWDILREIPYGQIMTYGEVAKSAAEITGKKSMSAQAVGGAVGHNPISIIIPCHRVVGSSGSLTGYAGGILTKLKLLEHEGVDVTKLSVPTSGTAL